MPLTPTYAGASRTMSMTMPSRAMSGQKPPGLGGPVMRQPGLGINPQDEIASLQYQFPGADPQQLGDFASQTINFHNRARQQAMANPLMGGSGGGGQGGMPGRAHGGPVMGRTQSMMPTAHPYVVNEKGQEAFKPDDGGRPQLIPGGEHVQTFPTDGTVIPAGRTAHLMHQGKIPHRDTGGDVQGRHPMLHPHGGNPPPTWMQFSGLDPRQGVRVGKKAGTEGHASPMSYAGRTGGLAKFYQDQNRLSQEGGERGALDPVGGLSQTPTEAEMAAQIKMLNDRGDADQAALMQDYYNAKRSGNPAALAQAAADVQARKHELNALRAQPAAEAGGTGSLPVSGAGSLPAQSGNLDSAAPQESHPIIPGLSPQAGRTASFANRSISTPYGTGSVTNAPRVGPATFNVSDTYDPNFASKTAGMAAGQPPPPADPYGAKAAFADATKPFYPPTTEGPFSKPVEVNEELMGKFAGPYKPPTPPIAEAQNPVVDMEGPSRMDEFIDENLKPGLDAATTQFFKPITDTKQYLFGSRPTVRSRTAGFMK